MENRKPFDSGGMKSKQDGHQGRSSHGSDVFTKAQMRVLRNFGWTVRDLVAKMRAIEAKPGSNANKALRSREEKVRGDLKRLTASQRASMLKFGCKSIEHAHENGWTVREVIRYQRDIELGLRPLKYPIFLRPKLTMSRNFLRQKLTMSRNLPEVESDTSSSSDGDSDSDAEAAMPAKQPAKVGRRKPKEGTGIKNNWERLQRQQHLRGVGPSRRPLTSPETPARPRTPPGQKDSEEPDDKDIVLVDLPLRPAASRPPARSAGEAAAQADEESDEDSWVIVRPP